MKHDPAAFEAAIAGAAERIRAYAAAQGLRPEEVRRARYRADTGDHSRAIVLAWGPCLERASEGEHEAPPLEPVPSGHRVKGVSTLVDASGAVVQQWVKTVEDGPDPLETIARAMERCASIPPAPAVRAPEHVDSDLLAVYPMGDPHVGMLAWSRESGDSFDLAIAERLITGAVVDLVRRGPPAREALIVNLGDYFHFDNADARTTSGSHALDVDGRTAKILEVGVAILERVVLEALEKHERVTLWNIAGNHDRHTSHMLAIAMRQRFRSNPRVSIPVEPSSRSYMTWGSVLIGATHGDRAHRPEDLAAIMATERRQEWGLTDHHVWLLGHVHHSSVKEVRGCVVETFRTLAARDAWHAGQGYSAGRDMRRITYHRTHGEVSREIVSLSHLREASSR